MEMKIFTYKISLSWDVTPFSLSEIYQRQQRTGFASIRSGGVRVQISELWFLT